MEGRDDIVAVGDVARFPNPLRGDDQPARVEHWAIPAHTARRAAHTLVHGPDDDPFAPLSSFWSDQHATRLQSYGSADAADEIAVLERSEGAVVYGYRRWGVLVGVVGLGEPVAAARHRNAIATAVPAVR